MASNPFMKDFVTDLRSRYPRDGVKMTNSEWICANTRLNNKPFSTKGYEFQTGIINDNHHDLSVKKPSQVGMTEVQIRKFFTLLVRNRGTSGIFTFPNADMFKRNSKTRIRPIVTQPAFGNTGLDDEKPNRSMSLYEVNGSFGHIMGMTEGEATSTPADFLFEDELDLSDQAMVALYQSRLQNSDWKMTQAFSTPTHAAYGIDSKIAASDQREYFMKCQSCGHQQIPEWDERFLHLPGFKGSNLRQIDDETFQAIQLDESYVKCERCQTQLDLANPDLREWVPARPGRDAHGYTIRPFSTHKLPPSYIIRQHRKYAELDNLKGWHNTTLGETYSDSDSKLTEDVVKAVLGSPGRPEVSSDTPVAISSDMGRVCHVTAGVIDGDFVQPFLFEQVPASEIVEYMADFRSRYNVVCGGVDRHPYTPTSNTIRDESRGVILPIEYRGAAHINLVEDEYEVLDYAQINRTQAIDRVVRAVTNKRLKLTGYGSLRQVVISHLCDMVRIEVPEKPAVWQKLTGQDHFMHALVLLQASVGVHKYNIETRTVPVKKYFGVVGVDVPMEIPTILSRKPPQERLL